MLDDDRTGQCSTSKIVDPFGLVLSCRTWAMPFLLLLSGVTFSPECYPLLRSTSTGGRRGPLLRPRSRGGCPSSWKWRGTFLRVTTSLTSRYERAESCVSLFSVVFYSSCLRLLVWSSPLFCHNLGEFSSNWHFGVTVTGSHH